MHIKNFDPYDFSKKEIQGVPVYFKKLPWSPCVNIHVVFRTGGFSDPVGKEGLSHFLEHMIFNGSPKLKNKKAITEWSKRYAINSFNAWTSLHETAYHLRCLPENYKKAIEGMKDMVFNPYLRSKDVEHERGVITQEAWRRFKNEKFLAYTKRIGEIISSDHNLARISTALGWPSTVAKISQKDIKKWHTDKYVRNNMSIVLVGAVEEVHLKGLESFIKGIPEKEVKSYDRSLLKEPLESKTVFMSEEIGDPSEQVEITISRYMQHLPVEKAQLSSIFRYLISDILFSILRGNKGLCYGVSVNTILCEDFYGIYMNMKTEEKNMDLVQNEFWKVLKGISLGKYKNKFAVLKKVYLEELRSKELVSEDIAGDAVKDIIRYGSIIPLFTEIKRLEEVTYKDIISFAKEVFDKKYTHTEIIMPIKK